MSKGVYIRADYISLLTNIEQLENKVIARKRDELLERTDAANRKYPKANNRSYRKAQKDLKKKEEQLQREKQRQEMARKKKKRKKILFSCFVGAAAAFCAIAWFAIYQTQYNSFDIQMAQAESEFSNKDYKHAMKYLERALELQPNNAEANILQAKIYLVNGEEEKALATLLAAIETSPDSVSAYGELLRLYEKQENYPAIKGLMDSCIYSNIKEFGHKEERKKLREERRKKLFGK